MRFYCIFLIVTFCMGTPLFSAHALPIKQVKRIVSLGPILTQMIYLLDADEKLVGVTSYCKTPPGKPALPVVGTVMHMNTEQVITLEPDVVFANSLTSKKQIRLLEKEGLRIITLETPDSFAGICDRLELIANIVDKKESGSVIIQKAISDVRTIRTRAEKFKKRSVFMQIGLKPLKTAGMGTFINDYIEFAGGINIAANIKDGVFARERVLEYDPDIILISTMGSSEKMGEKVKNSWYSFTFLRACRNREIYVLDPEIVCSPTPSSFANGLSVFFKLIHPRAGEKQI